MSVRAATLPMLQKNPGIEFTEVEQTLVRRIADGESFGTGLSYLLTHVNMLGAFEFRSSHVPQYQGDCLVRDRRGCSAFSLRARAFRHRSSR